ncbi:endonuclease domain-containing protein [Microbacterium sp. NPDC058021]|uniref:endonuclease domain-containing protein n=1 Tax=Microbacterium sp. NPDC058021 TaxID=3346306 RepID=UPI0036DB326B
MFGVWECATRAELLAAGMSRRGLRGEVAAGRLIRARRDRYLRSDAPPALREAVRVGGRLACVSLLQLLGVFVLANAVTHVHIARGSSRLRSPEDPGRRLGPPGVRRARLHWHPLLQAEEANRACVGVVDALVQAIRCQPARHAVASIDSALNTGVIAVADLAEVFGALPARFGVLRDLVDGRAQSGPETLVRLMARSLGCRVELQVRFDGVGYVDLLLDGWLVVECDGKEFHEGWAQQVTDRRRDLRLATLGYVCTRFTAAQILYHPEEVVAALRGLLAAHAGCAR